MTLVLTTRPDWLLRPSLQHAQGAESLLYVSGNLRAQAPIFGLSVQIIPFSSIILDYSNIILFPWKWRSGWFGTALPGPRASRIGISGGSEACEAAMCGLLAGEGRACPDSQRGRHGRFAAGMV